MPEPQRVNPLQRFKLFSTLVQISNLFPSPKANKSYDTEAKEKKKQETWRYPIHKQEQETNFEAWKLDRQARYQFIHIPPRFINASNSPITLRYTPHSPDSLPGEAWNDRIRG